MRKRIDMEFITVVYFRFFLALAALRAMKFGGITRDVECQDG